MLKPFDEFLDTLSDNDFNKMLEEAVSSVKRRSKTSAATDLNDIVLIQTITILRRYHSWLSEQLEQ